VLEYVGTAGELTRLLGLVHPPLAITFAAGPPEGVPYFDDPFPTPTLDGRSGRVAAGCVFWIKAAERTFATAPEDHGNCSVGSLTHGLTTLEEAAEQADVAALVENEWVSPEVLPGIPTVNARPHSIIYGPLSDTPVDPDVVFLRLNAKQLMVLHDAWPSLRVEGKPQCHIIAIAKEQGEVAASVGCMLSRARTGMPASEMTCAIPATSVAALVERLRGVREADDRVARYAAADAKRFG
jgi:uncharacterized protein (DUF169 family)